MTIKRCAACKGEFRPRPQVPNQTYCPSPQCQRKRRSRREQKKRQTDPDYRDNQARAQQAWLERNPDYYRKYRDDHPDSTERNRKQQQVRNQKRQSALIAKVDASTPKYPLPSVRYRLTPVSDDGIAKMDVWTVEIIALS